VSHPHSRDGSGLGLALFCLLRAADVLPAAAVSRFHSRGAGRIWPAPVLTPASSYRGAHCPAYPLCPSARSSLGIKDLGLGASSTCISFSKLAFSPEACVVSYSYGCVHASSKLHGAGSQPRRFLQQAQDLCVGHVEPRLRNRSAVDGRAQLDPVIRRAVVSCVRSR